MPRWNEPARNSSAAMSAHVGELRALARRWDRQAEGLTDRINGESAAAAAEIAREGSVPQWMRKTGAAVVPVSPDVPEWLHDLDRDWQGRRADLLADQFGAGAKLRATASSYKEVEDYTTSVFGGSAAGVRHGADTGADYTRGAALRAGPDTVDPAIALWKVRATVSAEVRDDLAGAALASTEWTGLAEQEYTRWLAVHRAHWDALAATADDIRAALASHTAPGAPGSSARQRPAPTLAPASVIAAAALEPSPDPTSGLPEPTALPEQPTPADPPGPPSSPVLPAPVPVQGQPGEQPAAPASDSGPSGGVLPDASTAAPAADAEHGSPADPGSHRSSGALWRGLPTEVHGGDSPNSDPAPDTTPPDSTVAPAAQTQSPETGTGTETSDNGVPHAHTGVGDPPSEPGQPALAPSVVVIDEVPKAMDGATAAALVGVGSGTAATSMAALAQQPHVLHILGSGPPAGPPVSPAPPALNPAPPAPSMPAMPPPALPAAPAPTAAPWTSAAGALADGMSSAYLPASVPGDLPRRGVLRPAVPWRTSSGPQRPDRAPAPYADLNTGPDLDPVAGPLVDDPSRPWRTGRVTVALDTGRDLEVWADLTGGLGLTGLGARDVTRTALARLLTQPGPPPRVLTTTLTVNRLVGADPPQTDPALLHQLDKPSDVVDLLADEITRRQRPGARPLVLLLSVPREPDRITALRQLLDDGRRRTVGAVLLGDWPHGATLVIDDDHTVRDHLRGEHTRPRTGHGSTSYGPRHPADLTGRQLHPTGPDDLRTRLQTITAAPTTSVTARLFTTSSSAASSTAPPAAHDEQPDPVSRHQPDATEPHDQAQEQDTQGRTAPDVVDEQPVTNNATEPTESRSVAGNADGAPQERDAGASGPFRLSVLGRPITLRLLGDPDDPDSDQDVPLTGRMASLLAYLATEPALGVTQKKIVATLWPDTRAQRKATGLHQVLKDFRKLLDRTCGPQAATIIHHYKDSYRLTDAVTVDYWDLAANAVTLRRTSSAPDRAAAETMIAVYGGPFAADHDAGWTTKAREDSIAHYLTAFNALVGPRGTLAAEDPDRAIAILEAGRELEPTNEWIYREIMRAHHAAGRHSIAAVTYDHLRAVLAGIDLEPDVETLDLAARIQNARLAEATRHHNDEDTPPAR